MTPSLWLSLACTLLTLLVFVGMSMAYSRKRAHRKYAFGKEAAPSISCYATPSKFLFITSMLLTMLSHWYSHPLLLPLYKAPSTTLLGSSLIALGFVFLLKSFRDIGNNYSPMFDAFVPSSLVTQNIYRYIRHPIYLFNLVISSGLAIASGLGIVFINSLIGGIFVLRAITLEEKYLAERFPHYATYSKNSWRLLPFLY